MSYQGSNPLVRLTDAFNNPASLDAFGRLRMSAPYALLSGKQVFSNDPLAFEVVTTGTGASSWTAARAATLLQVGNGGIGTAIRQSRRYLNYQPGKSQLIFITYRVDAGLAVTANTRARVGYFDSSDGLFLEVLGPTPTLSFNRRSSATGGIAISVPQASWNIDTLDGSGPSSSNPSGINLLVADASQILFIEFEWLGVGSATMGFVIDGRLVPAHRFDFANNVVGGQVYMRTPNLPVRWEAEAFADLGFTVSLTSVCASVMSEGGSDPVGIVRSANRGSANGKIATAASLESLIRLRLTAGAPRAPVEVLSLTLIASNNAQVRWELLLNATVGGASAWVAPTGGDSVVEYDVNLTAAASRPVTNGTLLASGYFAGTQGAGVTRSDFRSLVGLTTSVGGTRDELTLAVSPIGATETMYGSMDWIELA
jgi:hypothetical protein